MPETNTIVHAIPQSPHPFRVPRTATGLLLATAVLAVLLFFSTVQNIDRAQLLMEGFLSDKGETIMRSIEAGSRASRLVMHQMNGVDPLHTLLMENSKDDDILFIRILNMDGSVVDQAGYPEAFTLTGADIESITTSGRASKHLYRDAGVFTFSNIFAVDDHARWMHMPADERAKWLSQFENSRKIISIGLNTEQFDIAREQDEHHAMFMGALLLLVGSAGLYVFFLYQKMRLTGAKLADMKLYTDSVIASIPVSLITLDVRDYIVSCNKNTEELFGYPLCDLQQKSILDTLPHIAEAIADARATMIEHQIAGQHRDGRPIPLGLSYSPLVNHENKNIGKVLVIRNMSSIRNMEIQLERSRKMAALGKMAAGIAHEVRNPLGTLRGFAQFFGGQGDGTADHKKYADLMVSEIDRLNHIVSSLLQFSRPREPHPQTIILDELFNKVRLLMEADIANNGVHFHLQANSGIDVEADPDLILQVLMNLLKNSINATPAGGTISLGCLEDEHHVRITVADTGCGMSEEEREKMFDPFFTTARTGTGLGLAVSHQILEQHHGTLEVITEKDQGTTITIVLPK